MKNTWVFVFALGMVLGNSFGSAAFAEEGMEMMDPQKQQPQSKNKMMGMMQKDSVIATSDGGVVVLSGPRLLKYDSELTLIKEVELPRGKKPQREPATEHTPEQVSAE